MGDNLKVVAILLTCSAGTARKRLGQRALAQPLTLIRKLFTTCCRRLRAVGDITFDVAAPGFEPVTT
jgi:hypothetical protein